MDRTEPEPPLLRHEQSLDAMGSTFSIILYGRNSQAMHAAIRAAWSEIARVEELLSPYRPSSELSSINRNAGRHAIPVSPELFQILSACLDYNRLTDGAFDIGVGPLLRTWGFYRGRGKVPTRNEAAMALANVGSGLIELDPANRTVRFKRPGVELAPGGFGKGYAVDCAVCALKKCGFGCALVAGSESSLYGLGAPPSEPRGWGIDIRDPVEPGRSAATVHLKDLSLSTSGSSEKHFWEDGSIYSHIMDPRTGYPSQGVFSASVLAPRAMDSEVWTKPCILNGSRWFSKNKPDGFRAFVYDESNQESFVWVD